jgi:tripartite-type tricarboxylate transporter receptor subunit TctC
MAMFTNPVLAIPAARAGSLRAIAVTGASRSAQLSALPTIAEQGYPGYESGTWYGFLGPAGMAEAVVQRIHADTQRALASPALQGRFAAMGLEVLTDGPAAFAARMAEDLARWTKVISDARISTD